MKRFILTDAGNVLTTFRFRAELVREIMAGFGVNEVDLRRVFTRSELPQTEENYYRGLDTGEFDVFDIWDKLWETHAVDRATFSYPLFLSLWCRHLQPVAEVAEFYKSLQDRHPLVLVSNGDSEGVRHLLYHLIGRYGLRFAEVFISAERKQTKPELLRSVVSFIRQQGSDPSRCVFVDDLPHYVAAAAKHGIPAVEFDATKDPVKKLEQALADLGFK